MNFQYKIGDKIWTEHDIELSDSVFAYKHSENKMYHVHTSKQTVTAMGCIGRMCFVLNEQGHILATAYPLMTFNNGFEKIEKGMIDNWKLKLKAFDNL